MHPQCLFRVAALWIAGLTVTACATRPRVPVVASSLAAEPCTANVDGADVADVADWKTVESEGFSFCVPRHWQLNHQALRLQATRRNSDYRVLSWGSPDSSEHVVFEVPHKKFAMDALNLTLARGCGLPFDRKKQGQPPYSVQGQAPYEVLGQNACVVEGPVWPVGSSQIVRGNVCDDFAIKSRSRSGCRFADPPAQDMALVFRSPPMLVRFRGLRNAHIVVETVRPLPGAKAATEP